MTNIRTTWEKLVAPFPFEDIEIKCMTLSTKNPAEPKALAAPYFNARAVMNRLDEVVGPENWGATYTPIITGTHTGFLCDLWVEIEGKRIERQDAAECTDIESIKGGISDALKRAFAALGSRFLYEVDLGWHPCTTYEGGGKPKFGGFTPQALNAMRAKYNAALNGNAPQKAVQEAKTSKYPGSGEYLKTLNLTTSEVEAFKQRCSEVGKPWGEVALGAKANGDQDFDDLMTYVRSLEGAAA